MTKKSSKFHFIIDFGEDITLEQAEGHLDKALARRERHLFPSSEKTKIEDAGIASDRIYLLKKKDITREDMRKVAELATKAVENSAEREKNAEGIKKQMEREGEILEGMDKGTIKEKEVIAYIKELTNTGLKSIELEAERRKLQEAFEK